ANDSVGAGTALAAVEPATLPGAADTEISPGKPGSGQETHATALQVGPRSPSDRLTQAGQVMGTPAFMSPEQARGAIEVLDERADVSGLGAILLVLLTGAPPYQEVPGQSVFRRAAQADLAESYQRLGACGADKNLIELCKDCLEADTAKRPAHAGIV